VSNETTRLVTELLFSSLAEADSVYGTALSDATAAEIPAPFSALLDFFKTHSSYPPRAILGPDLGSPSFCFGTVRPFPSTSQKGGGAVTEVSLKPP